MFWKKRKEREERIGSGLLSLQNQINLMEDRQTRYKASMLQMFCSILGVEAVCFYDSTSCYIMPPEEYKLYSVVPGTPIQIWIKGEVKKPEED